MSFLLSRFVIREAEQNRLSQAWVSEAFPSLASDRRLDNLT